MNGKTVKALQVDLFLNIGSHREVMCVKGQTMQELLCMNNRNNAKVSVYEQWNPHKSFCI